MSDKSEFAVKMIMEYSEENQILPRSTSDLSPFEQWLVMRLFKQSISATPFEGLKIMQNNTAGASWQLYYSKRRGEFVVHFTNLFTSFHSPNPLEVIREAEDFILRERKKNEGNPKFTLFH